MITWPVISWFPFTASGYREKVIGSIAAGKLQMLSAPETALPTIWAPYILTGH